MSASDAAAQIADLPKADDGFRVYVGNLSFSATEDEVREFVSKAGGEISSVTLPVRYGRRPAGYAFVSYKKEEDAKKVVEQLNETELGDRKIRLEIAKPAEEVLERRQAKDEKRKATRDAAKAAKAEGAAAKAEEAGAGAATDAEAKDGEVKSKKKPKAKKPRRRLPEEGEEAEGAGETSETAAPKAAKPRKAPKEARIDVNGAEGEQEKEKKVRAPKPKREARLKLSSEQSKSTIFVANLPFSVDDDALAAIFTNLSIKVKSAKVVQGIRRAGSGSRPFRASKGFGFVEVEDAAQQAEAVSKVEGTLIGDRTITAKIAMEMKPIEAEQAKEAGVEVPAEIAA